MANEYRDFPHAGRMTLKVTGGSGNVVVETDRDAVGARAYLDGPDGPVGDVKFQHNGGSLEVIQARVPGAKAGGGVSSTYRSADGGTVRHSITGDVTGIAVQLGDVKGNLDLSGLTMGRGNFGDAVIQVGGVDVSPSRMSAQAPPVAGVDLHIVLPAGSDVEVSGVAAEKIEFRGDFGSITTDLDESKITTTGRFGNATLNLGSGEITVGHVAAGSTITANLRDGHIKLQEVFGSGSATSRNGNVTATAANPDGELTLTTRHGHRRERSECLEPDQNEHAARPIR